MGYEIRTCTVQVHLDCLSVRLLHVMALSTCPVCTANRLQRQAGYGHSVGTGGKAAGT